VKKHTFDAAQDAPGADAMRALLEVMATLRTPGTGCSWDLQQSFADIAPYTIEEAYEVAEAIEHKDMHALKDELGDLLFNVVFHARLAEEGGLFTFDDIARTSAEKMIRRHPHVFGDTASREAGDVPGQWDRIKAEEKEARGSVPESVLDGVPAALPALTRAVKLQRRAGKAGFEWPEIRGVFAKAREEFDELAAEIESGADKALIKAEFGDLLFVMANLARWLKIDPEHAVRGANAKFIRRFQHVEAGLAARGLRPEDATLEEMDALWDEAKAGEKAAAAAAER
jgi:ATP diphosphatase